METVENADGSVSLVRDDSVGVGDVQVDGPVTWQYLGQEHYTDAGPGTARWVETQSRWRDRSVEGQVLGARRYDDEGGEWIAVAVDVDAVLATVAEQDAAMAEDLGLDLALVEADAVHADGDEWEWTEGESYWWEPQGFTSTVCGGETYHIYDTDDRETQSSLTNRQKSSAYIEVDLGSTTKTCSGVFLWSGAVLTAAHCIYKDDDTLVQSRKITVCSQGNSYAGADCALAKDRKPHPDYTGGDGIPSLTVDAADDMAIINVPAISGHGYMWLSGATDSTVTAYTMHDIAYPIYSPPPSTCTNIRTTPVSSMAIDGSMLTHTMGDISSSIIYGSYHTTMDGGPGHSGSPVYYCGDAWCDSGENGYVVGVWSGWNGFWTRHTLSKVNERRLWIMSMW